MENKKAEARDRDTRRTVKRTAADVAEIRKEIDELKAMIREMLDELKGL